MVDCLKDSRHRKQHPPDHLDAWRFLYRNEFSMCYLQSGLEEVITQVYTDGSVYVFRQRIVTYSEGTYVCRQNIKYHNKLINVRHLCAIFCYSKILRVSSIL